MAQFWTLPTTLTIVDTAIRTNIVQMLETLRTLNSGGSAPTNTSPFMLWADSALGWLNQRNSGDTDFVKVAPLGVSWTRTPIICAFGLTISATQSIRLATPHRGMIVSRVVLMTDTTSSGSDGSNHWAFNIRNETQSAEEMLGSDVTTNGNETAADTAFVVTPDQNEEVAANDCLFLDVTKVGSPSTASLANVTVQIEFEDGNE